MSYLLLIYNKIIILYNSCILPGVIVYPKRNATENMMQWTEISNTENL